MLTAPAGVVGPASIASYAGVFTQSLKNGARASSIGARAVFSGRARMFHVSEDSGGDVSEDSGRNTGVQASELFENSVGSSNAGMASPLCEKFEDSASRRGGRPSRRSRRQMLAQAMLSASAVLSVAPGALVRSAAAASAGAPGAAAAEGQSGFVSGIAVSLVKQTVLYPIDTVKVRLQTTPLAAGEAVWTRAGLFRGLYRGFLLPLIFNAPAGGVFFAAKDAVKSSLANLGNIPSTLVAIFVAQFPYWLVRQPSEVLKVRRQAVCAFGNAAGAGAAPGEEQGWGGIAAALRESAELLDVRKPGTVESLSLGFGSNLAYTFPADALKFMAYDYLKVEAKRKLGAKPNPLQSAVLGAAASILAQACTTPLDVARNRIMKSRDPSEPSPNSDPSSNSERRRNSDYSNETFLSAIGRIYREEGPSALMLGFTPRVFRAIFSGALQFSTYEFTKGKAGG